MASWYRKFIQDFSNLIKPLNNLLINRKNGQKISWTPEANESFEKLKICLSSAPVLTNPDFSKLFTIQCDASDIAVSCVLIQGEGVEEHVIAYASRTLTKTERAYTATELELAAVLFSVNKFLSYVQGVKFRVITDHSSLLWLNRLKNPTGRLARWAAQLSQFDIEFRHRSGKLNVVPDALSRAPINISSIDIENEPDKWYQKMLKNVTSTPEKFPLWHVDDGRPFKFIKSKHDINTNSKQWKTVVPKARRLEILRQCHDRKFPLWYKKDNK